MPKRQNSTKKKATRGIVKSNPGKVTSWRGMQGRAQPGWETSTVRPRPSRSFGAQREQQVLRHVSRQLFPYLKSLKEKPVEIQMMWANDSLFVGTNKDRPTRKLGEVINDGAELKRALRKVWGKSGETHNRTSRSVAKLKRLSRLDLSTIDPDDLDIDQLVELASCHEAKNIYDILMTKTAEELHCKSSKAANKALSPTHAGRLYYVIEGNNKGRHIEEKFIDILEAAGYRGRAVIAGVKRPCGTCWIRLEKARKNHIEVEYSPYPGQIWKGQAESLGLSDSDIDRYVHRGTYRSAPGGTDYDSASDSDEDDDLF